MSKSAASKVATPTTTLSATKQALEDAIKAATAASALIS